MAQSSDPFIKYGRIWAILHPFCNSSPWGSV